MTDATAEVPRRRPPRPIPTGLRAQPRVTIRLCAHIKELRRRHPLLRTSASACSRCLARTVRMNFLIDLPVRSSTSR
jgi:hypothetical protein